MLLGYPNNLTDVEVRQGGFHHGFRLFKATCPQLSKSGSSIRNLRLRRSVSAIKATQTMRARQCLRTQHTVVCTGCLLTVEVEVGLEGGVE